MATGKTLSKYTVITYNSQILSGVTSITGVGYNYPEVDLSDLASAQKFVGLGIPESKVQIKGLMDNTASTGTHTVLTAAATLGSQTGAPLLIDYGIRATATTGDPRFSNTLMAVSDYKVDVSNPNSAPTFSATLVASPSSVLSWTTKP